VIEWGSTRLFLTLTLLFLCLQALLTNSSAPPSSPTPPFSSEVHAALEALTLPQREPKTMVVAVFNPLAWTRNDVIQVGPVEGRVASLSAACLTVASASDPTSSPLLAQVVFDSVRAQTTLYFQATLAPLALSTFVVTCLFLELLEFFFPPFAIQPEFTL
jgi:hypothetical protein